MGVTCKHGFHAWVSFVHPVKMCQDDMYGLPWGLRQGSATVAHHGNGRDDLKQRRSLIVHQLLKVAGRCRCNVHGAVYGTIAHGLGVVDAANNAQRLQDQEHGQSNVEIIARRLQEALPSALRATIHGP